MGVRARKSVTWTQGLTIGYHSTRRIVAPVLATAILPVYLKVRAEERAVGRKAEAAALGLQCVHNMIAESGQSYDEWM
ncbi:MAG: hypothetical protein ABI382_06000 [Nakamurella sp.]